MNIAVRPGPLRGRVEIPASKSVAHRAMIAAAPSCPTSSTSQPVRPSTTESRTPGTRSASSKGFSAPTRISALPSHGMEEVQDSFISSKADSLPMYRC